MCYYVTNMETAKTNVYMLLSSEQTPDSDDSMEVK